VRFTSPWQAGPGTYHILARATDERGLRQPLQAEWNAKGYGQNGIHRITVTAADSAQREPVEGTSEGREQP
jgi:hypothetical protein